MISNLQYIEISGPPRTSLDGLTYIVIGSELQFDPCPMIQEGMMVEVIHGPLKGVIGRLVRKDAPRARLVLSVDGLTVSLLTVEKKLLMKY